MWITKMFIKKYGRKKAKKTNQLCWIRNHRIRGLIFFPVNRLKHIGRWNFPTYWRISLVLDGQFKSTLYQIEGKMKKCKLANPYTPTPIFSSICVSALQNCLKFHFRTIFLFVTRFYSACWSHQYVLISEFQLNGGVECVHIFQE